MPRAKTFKEPTTPKHSEPHTVDIPDLESYNAMVQKPPYTYLPRCLPQNVLALMLQDLWSKKKRFVRIYLPEEVFVNSYRANPAMFAGVIRKQKQVEFQFVTLRYEKEADRFRLTASETAPQKRGSYLGSCVASLLGEHQKLKDARRAEDTFCMTFPYEGMPRAYSNDQHVFRHRLERAYRKSAEDETILFKIAIVEAGYRITRVPKDFSTK